MVMIGLRTCDFDMYFMIIVSKLKKTSLVSGPRQFDSHVISLLIPAVSAWLIQRAENPIDLNHYVSNTQIHSERQHVEASFPCAYPSSCASSSTLLGGSSFVSENIFCAIDAE